MPTEQLLVRLPSDLVRRLRQRVPPRQRSAFLERLIEQALAPEEIDDPLYRAAVEVGRDEKLAAEMAEWDVTIADGFEPPVVPSRGR